ncbi:MAG: radical SAM protein [Firmicutes bacterium]|nr:radical SAM protein [Bacillota bacterium]
MKELGIYIHIPFCAKKCDYCDFVSYQNKEDYIDKYINALKKEIESVGVATHSYPGTCGQVPQQYIIKTIYIGGGTPSFINACYIQEVLQAVREKFNVAEDAEITIEVNPGTVDKEKLDAYYKSGINRISIGLQSSNNNELKLIGRIHSVEKFLEAYNLALEAGFRQYKCGYDDRSAGADYRRCRRYSK